MLFFNRSLGCKIKLIQDGSHNTFTYDKIDSFGNAFDDYLEYFQGRKDNLTNATVQKEFYGTMIKTLWGSIKKTIKCTDSSLPSIFSREFHPERSHIQTNTHRHAHKEN